MLIILGLINELEMMEYHLLLAINFYDAFHSIFFRKRIITSRKTVSQNPFRETKREYVYIAFCIKGLKICFKTLISAP